MVELLTTLLFLVHIAVWPALVQGYLVPKLVILAVFGIGAATLLLSRREIWLPRLELWTLGTMLCLGIAIAQLGLSSETYGVCWVGGVSVFLLTLSLEETECVRLRSGFFGVALFQVALVLSQFVAPGFWATLDIGFVPARSSGLVGNREFLATLLGLGLLLRFPTWWDFKSCRSLFLKSGGILMIATLILVASKGTLLLVVAAWALPRRERIPRWAYGGGVGVLAVIAVASESVRSRIAIWAAAVWIGIRHLPFGAGAGGFGQNYVAAIESAFSRFPALRSGFGDLSGVLDDAHNIVLQSTVEAGLLGLAASGLFTFGLWQGLRKERWGKDRGAIVLVLAKLLYTVVFTSPSSMLTVAVAFGICYPRSRRVSMPVHVVGRAALVGSFVAALVSGVSVAVAGKSELLYSAGMRQLRLQNYSIARDTFDHLNKFSPTRADGWLGSALVAIKGHPSRDPEPYIGKALALSSDFNTLKIAAKAYLLSGDCFHAAELYQRIHLTFPQHLSSLTGLAVCAQALGDKVGAREYALKLLATRPRVPTATYGLNLLTAEDILEKTQ